MIFDITRLTDVAGQDFTSPKCRVRSPHITARDSIEIGNYIVAKQKRIAELEKELESALYFNVDVVRCLSKVAWEHNHHEIPCYMELAKGCIVTIEAKPFKAIKGSK